MPAAAKFKTRRCSSCRLQLSSKPGVAVQAGCIGVSKSGSNIIFIEKRQVLPCELTEC